MDIYDVAVIGSGPAGGGIARKCKSAGMKVVVIEKYGLGGTCPLVGCEPKKVLADIAEAVERFKNSEGHGVSGDAGINWKDLMEFKSSFTDPIPALVRRAYTKKGIDIYEGAASFSGPDTLKVGDTEIKAEKICIAGGAKPRPLDIKGEELLATNNDFFELNYLPEKIAFIGGGFISFELAHIAAVAGAEVTIINRSERVLRNFDIDLVERLCSHLEKIGVNIVLNCPPKSLERTATGLMLKAGDDGQETFEADYFVHGAGRVPDIDDLRLDLAGVETKSGGIAVNKYMQSVSNPSVYAAGDVVKNKIPLTPTAARDADVVAESIINGNSREIEYGAIPYVLFTYPPIAAVGLFEDQATDAGYDFEVLTKDAAKWSEYKRLGQECAEFKIIIDKKNRQILGAHFMGDKAEEVINLVALAINKSITIEELADMLWAYPSFGYTIKYMLR